MATSGDVWTNDVGNSRLHLYWWLDGSTINWWLKFSKDDSNYRTLWNFAVYRNDDWIDGSNTQRNVYDGDVLAEGSFNISALSNGYLKFEITGGIGTSSVNATGEDDWTIALYANITASVSRRSYNSITINWSTDANVSTFQYKLNSGSWIDAETNINKRSGSFTITNLTPNTSYKISFDALRIDGDWSTHGGIDVYVNTSTYDIGKISSVPGFEHGSNAVVTITNPSGAALSLEMSIGATEILSASPTAGTNQISFTQAQLDKIYKLYGSSNSLTATFVLNTGTYTNTKTATITLTGNQKTAHTSQGRARVYVGANGVKPTVVWVGNNGNRRCI